jgi:hypothetical protein
MDSRAIQTQIMNPPLTRNPKTRYGNFDIAVLHFAHAFTQAPRIGEDEDLRIDEVPQEGNSGDSGDDDLPIFEG